MRDFLAMSLLLLTAILPAGCGKSDDTANSTPAPRAVPSGSATIHGLVFFDGTAPAIKVVSPPNYWATATDPTIIVNPNGTLKDVLVYLQDGPPGDGGGPPVILDQRNATYVPHVLALQVGQPLIIRSSDAHFHNVHIDASVNRQQNYPMQEPGDLPPITFKVPEFFQIKCDVHPWMDCQVGVFDHPYFAVTGDDGSFVIHNVPPGNYTLAAKHERYGDLTQQITLTDQQTTEVTFRYKQP
jgi:hypothetical protein